VNEPGSLKDIEYRYHVRVFGEEWARINFLPPDERRRAYHEIMDNARRHGYREEKPALGVTP
jgi:hypothetical protein